MEAASAGGGRFEHLREHSIGLPQVLFEAFAAGLPVVATEVGGVPTAAAGAALLVPPGDAERPAEERLAEPGEALVGLLARAKAEGAEGGRIVVADRKDRIDLVQHPDFVAPQR